MCYDTSQTMYVMGRYSVTTAYVGKTVSITYCECVFVASCLACKSAFVLCHMCPVRVYNIFQHYIMNGTFYRKTFSIYNLCVLISYTIFFFGKISHSKKNSATYCLKGR